MGGLLPRLKFEHLAQCTPAAFPGPNLRIRELRDHLPLLDWLSLDVLMVNIFLRALSILCSSIHSSCCSSSATSFLWPVHYIDVV